MLLSRSSNGTYPARLTPDLAVNTFEDESRSVDSYQPACK
jgi:hypothetical protein